MLTDSSSSTFRRAFSVQWILLGAFALLLALALVLLFRWTYQSIWQLETERISARAELIANAFDEQLRTLNAGLDGLAERIQDLESLDSASVALIPDFASVARMINGVDSIVLADRSGAIVSGNKPAQLGSNLGGAVLDQLLRPDLDPRVLRMSLMFNGPSDARSVAFGRHVLERDGRVKAHLVAFFQPEVWRANLKVGLYSDEMLAVLVQHDGQPMLVVSRQSPSGGDLSSRIDTAMGRFLRLGALQSTTLEPILSNETEQLVAFHRIRPTLVGLSSNPAIVLIRDPAVFLTGWTTAVSIAIAVGTMLLVGSCAVLLFFQRRWRALASERSGRDREREDAFARLAESEERFRTMFLKLPVAYLALDPSGLWIDANRQTVQLLKVDSLARILDRPFVDLWEHKFSAAYGGSFERFRGEAGDICEVVLLRGDGEPITAVAAFSEDRDIAGNLRRIHCVLFDITERRAMEAHVTKLNADLEEKVNARTAALAQANDLLRELARRDALTGLANRLAGNEMLQSSFAHLQATGNSYAVLLLDVDHFKNINDTFGHPVGDEVLKHIARTLQSLLRRSDFLARFGGEEFIAILRDTDLAAARMVAEKLRIAVSDAVHDEVGRITISIGLAMAARDDVDERVAVKLADQRLYEAKEAGRNRVVAPG